MVPFFAEPVPPLNDDPHFYQIFKHFSMHFTKIIPESPKKLPVHLHLYVPQEN